SDHTALGFGISYWNLRTRRHGPTARIGVVPVYFNYYFQTGLHRWFLTAGVDAIWAAAKYNTDHTFEAGGAAGVGGGGWELRTRKGFLLRLAAYGIAG